MISTGPSGNMTCPEQNMSEGVLMFVIGPV